MKFAFNDYQFDCERQLLTKSGNIIQLNEKPALLLSLLLSETDKIHSKSDILEKVWSQRVVTEQVVFQNISYLRALFGDDAIKTFSKKGYQWQLPLEIIEDEQQAVESEGEQTASQFADVDEAAKSSGLKVIALLALLIFSAAILYLLSQTNNQTAQPSMTLSQEHNSRVQVIDNTNSPASNQALDASLTNQQVFDSPFSRWQKYTTNIEQLLLSKRFYDVEGNVVLRFLIQGKERGWHDYIWAESQDSALSKLNRLLEELAPLNYFHTYSNHSALAELTVLANQHPDNELINQQLIKQLFKADELDRAMAMVDQLLAKNPSRLRQGLLHLSRTRIAQWNRRWSSAENSAQHALTIFHELEISHLESAALVENSWIHLINEDFRQGMQVLNQAASKARLSNEPLMEINAHLIQSFMASKADQIELMHTQLDLATEMIKLHQLSDEHMVPVYEHLGWIAGSSTNALEHYQAILDMPFSIQYEDDFYAAAEMVRDVHLAQGEWDAALSSIKPWQRESFQLLSHAHIAFAQRDWQTGARFGVEAFQKGQIDHIKLDTLDAALVLLKHSESAKLPLTVEELRAFIQRNATRRWISQNGSELPWLESSDSNE